MCVIEICHRVGDVREPGLTWGGVSAYIDQSIGIRPAFSETSALRYISTGWQTNTRSCQALCCQSSDHKWRFCTTAWTTEQKTEPTGQITWWQKSVSPKLFVEVNLCRQYLAWQCWYEPCGSSLICTRTLLSGAVSDCRTSLWKKYNVTVLKEFKITIFTCKIFTKTFEYIENATQRLFFVD